MLGPSHWWWFKTVVALYLPLDFLLSCYLKHNILPFLTFCVSQMRQLILFAQFMLRLQYLKMYYSSSFILESLRRVSCFFCFFFFLYIGTFFQNFWCLLLDVWYIWRNLKCLKLNEQKLVLKWDFIIFCFLSGFGHKWYQ